MSKMTLARAPKGSTVKIDSCLAHKNQTIYRLLEMGLYEGADVVILERFSHLNALELLVKKSHLCIANDLAEQFLVTIIKESA